MNLLTVFDKDELEWHGHFLIVPRKVYVYARKPEDEYGHCDKVQWLWLETVNRRLVNPAITQYDRRLGKFRYAKW